MYGYCEKPTKNNSLLATFAATVLLLQIIIFGFNLNPAFAVTTPQWKQQTSNTQKDLFGVDFVDANNGWIVGYDEGDPNTAAIILHTSNGGLNWSTQATYPVSGNFGGVLYDVDFIDSLHGYASGGSQSFCEIFAGGSGCFTIKRTDNGGSTWQDQDLNWAHGVQGIKFVDANNGWLVSGKNEIRHTSNGGSDGWPFQLGPNVCCSPDLTKIDFANLNTGWAVGGFPDIFKTTNGGTTWVNQASNLPSGYQNVFINNLKVIDSNTVFLVGNNGIILKTTNGGNTWAVQKSGTTANLNAVNFVNGKVGTIVGDSGIILTTSNGGTTWTIEKSGTTQILRDVVITSTGNQWVVGNNGIILKSIVAGATSNPYDTGKPLSAIQNVVNFERFFATEPPFSIQQNFVVVDPAGTPFLWAQNVVYINRPLCDCMTSVFQIYDSPGQFYTNYLDHQLLTFTSPIPSVFTWTSAKITLTSSIVNNKLIMINDASPIGNTVEYSVPLGSYILGSKEKYGIFDHPNPEIVLVGLANGANAEFQDPTTGSISTATTLLGGTGFKTAENLVLGSDTQTGETSQFLKFTIGGSFTHDSKARNAGLSFFSSGK